MALTELDEEKKLVEACAANRRQAQEQLYRTYFPAMMRMCLRYANDRDTALEILNNGFLKVFQKIHTFRFAGSLEGWIRRVIFHSLSDYFRSHSQTLPMLEWETHEEPVTSAALSNLYYEDILRLVDHLPDTTREVFMLFAIEGYTHVEIGEQLGISPGTSKWHLSMARKHLQELIRKQYNHSRYAG